MAHRMHGHDFESLWWQIMRLLKALAHLLRLRERKRRAARADPRRLRGGGGPSWHESGHGRDF